MYWKHGTKQISAPTIPLHVIGTDTDMELKLVTEAGEDLTNVYLFVPDPANVGLLSAKLDADSTYMDINGPFDANCHLGTIAASTETTIDIKVAFPSGATEGYTIIPIMVGHDDNAQLPNNLWKDSWTDVWLDDWTDVWREDW